MKNSSRLYNAITSFVLALSSVFVVASAGSSTEAKLSYPPAPRNTVTDDYFGTTVADPYRWLEDVDSPQTIAWVKAEGDLTRAYLDAIPQRVAIRNAFKKLYNYEYVSAPFREGKHWFYFHNSGLQNHNVLFIRDSETGPARVFFDPNKLSADGTVALAAWSFTHDGRYMAYATQSSGSDWLTWHARDVATNKDLSDLISWSKYSNAAWVGDKGFYYTGYDKPKGANTTLATLGVEKLWFHRLGTPQSADRLIYASTQHPDELISAGLTQDQRYVLFERWRIGGNSLAWKLPSEPNTAFKQVFPLERDVVYAVVGDDGTRVYVHTDKNAPRFRLSWFDVHDPRHQLHDIAPESADLLVEVSLIGNRFYLGYLHDAHSVVKVVDLQGAAVGSIDLRGIGYGGLPRAKREDRIAYYEFSSYTYPPTVYRYDTRAGHSVVAVQPKIAFDGTRYTTELLFARSKDGTKVPVFVTHRVDMPHDGTAPTILYGYGGFASAETPEFSDEVALWLQMGGVYADACLRGGSEYGEAWHAAGRLGQKQHVFDDFIAVAQMLIDQKITSTPKLAIYGISNGGLLVGAVETQRPDLFGAAIPEVGTFDMLRYQRWTIGKYWIPEFGSSEASAEQFHWLYSYSPVHNVRQGVTYPPTLIMTADHDDRVYPAHSFKFAASLQWAQAGEAPILLRVEAKAGHGGGLTTDKYLDQIADRYAFLVKSLGFNPDL